MKPFFKLSLSAVAALLLSVSWPAVAQPKSGEAKPKPAVEAVKDADPWKRRLPEVQFDNVPLSEVANHLSAQFPEINFVLHPNVKEIPVLLRLRSVTLDDIFTALDISTQVGGQGVDPTTGMAVPGGGLHVNKLNDRMVSLSYGQPAAVYVVKPVCRAFSLSRYLAGKSEKDVDAALNDIEEALQIAWKMLQAGEQSKSKAQQPSLNLHRATKLLIVVGQPEQVEVVEQVISQLDGGVAASGAGGTGFGLQGGPGGFSPSSGGATVTR